MMIKINPIRWSWLLRLLVALVFLYPFLFAVLNNRMDRMGLGPTSPAETSDLHSIHFVDLSGCANSDYHHNPFIPDPSKGSDHFPELKSGVHRFGRIAFRISAPHAATRKPTVITTGEDPSFSCSVPLMEKSSRSVHLAMDGAWLKDQSAQIARISITDEEGNRTEKLIVGNQDVWSYKADRLKVSIPERAILWQNAEGRKIVVVSIKLAGRKKPKALEIQALPADGIQHKQPAIAVFAVTQELA